jgi:hypothetical protein
MKKLIDSKLKIKSHFRHTKFGGEEKEFKLES